MKQKEITINGKNYPIVFNMKTMMNFEEITGKSFFDENFEKLKERIALVLAAVLSANADATLTVGEIIASKDFAALQEILAAYNEVMVIAGEFFKVPEIEKEKNPKPKEADPDAPKNA